MLLKDNGRSGTLKHRLVSYITKYDKKVFLCYTNMILNEMIHRNMRYTTKLFYEILEFSGSKEMYINDYFYPEHNDRYLLQCYYNLQEKYDRKIISEDEWQKINTIIKVEKV